MLKITVIVFSLRITLRCVGCDMCCISVLRCVYGRGGLGWEGTGKGGWVACWCMWITYRSKCYFLICANVIHRPWAVNWKLLNVTKKKHVCSLYSSASLLHIHQLFMSVSDFYTQSVVWSDRWTWRWAFVSQSVIKLTALIRLNSLVQTFMSPDKYDKMYF